MSSPEWSDLLLLGCLRRLWSPREGDDDRCPGAHDLTSRAGMESALVTRDVTDESTEYELVVRGRIGVRLRRAFEGFEVTSSGPDETHLRGWLPDQAGLTASSSRFVISVWT